MGIKIIANNRKAKHDFHLSDKYEAGIVLKGSEVKSIRENKCNIKEAYVRLINRELYLIGMHIGEYSKASYSSHSSNADRKLLVNKNELKKLKIAVSEKGKTLIPTSIYFKNGLVKLEFALAKGKKHWDKRADKMDKDIKRQIDRKIKGLNK
jgi:SsrA-binding protein